MTAIDIAALKALLEAATPTPWQLEADSEFGYVYARRGREMLLAIQVAVCEEGPEADHEANVTLIVAAVNALPELLAVYEAACKWRECDENAGKCLGNCLHDLADAVDASKP